MGPPTVASRCLIIEAGGWPVAPAVPVRVESAEERRARHAEAIRQAAAVNPVLAAHLARLLASRGR